MSKHNMPPEHGTAVIMGFCYSIKTTNKRPIQATIVIYPTFTLTLRTVRLCLQTLGLWCTHSFEEDFQLKVPIKPVS